jgi:lipopolysaccharide transport system ATP-binding protein
MSSNTPALDARGLGKMYWLARGAGRPTTLAEALVGRARAVLGREPRAALWALRDATFRIERGETIGIVGPNGAGKSTLLKILSRVTAPTEGTVSVAGRVGSLLEVGTGFHAELTGRENVFLSGAILGLKRREVAARLDEIVDFAEVGPLLDTPVKRYSSGMYVRLAFAVAAHMRPDILLVDEVLAVGDLRFQQKCLRHFSELQQSGLTLMLVSHNLATIQSTCRRSLLISGGRLIEDGPTLAVIESYRRLVQRQGGSGRTGLDEESAPIIFRGVRLTDSNGDPIRSLSFGKPFQIAIDIEARERIERPLVNIGFRRGDGVIICNFNNWYDGFAIPSLDGRCTLEAAIPPLRLIPDFYELHLLVWPWGGAHGGEDFGAAAPLASTVWDSIEVRGPGLNAHDGVFQIPARSWRLRTDSVTLSAAEASADAIYKVAGDASGGPGKS